MDKLNINNAFQNISLRQTGSVLNNSQTVNNINNSSSGSSILDKLDLSGISLRLSREMSNFKISDWKTSEDKAKDVPEISDEYIEAILEEGMNVDKPDPSIDDLTWGMMVQIGKEVGVSDPDVLMAMTTLDLDTYFNNAYKKDQAVEVMGMTMFDENGKEIIRSYDNPADIWKDIFLTDKEGNFVKDEFNKAVKNTQFKGSQSIGGIGGVVTHQEAEGDIFAPFGGELSKLAPSQLQNYLMAIHSGNFDMFQYAKDASSSRDGKALSEWKVSDKVSLLPHEERTQTYKEMLAVGYYNYKRALLFSKSAQEQMMLYNQNHLSSNGQK